MDIIAESKRWLALYDKVKPKDVERDSNSSICVAYNLITKLVKRLSAYEQQISDLQGNIEGLTEQYGDALVELEKYQKGIEVEGIVVTSEGSYTIAKLILCGGLPSSFIGQPVIVNVRKAAPSNSMKGDINGTLS